MMRGDLVAIETTGSLTSVALFRDGVVQGEQSLLAERSHGREILPLLRNVLDSGAFRADAIAVSVGPGSFTGIRVGMSAGRALAYAWDATPVAVPTLVAWAEALGGVGRTVALRPAGRDAMFAQVFGPGGAEEAGGPERLTHAEVLRLFGEERLVVVTDGPLPFPRPPGWEVRGGMDARAIGTWAVRHGEDGHDVGFHPIYLRPSQAEQGGS